MSRRRAWAAGAVAAALLSGCSAAKPVASTRAPSGVGTPLAASANPLPTVSPIADACTLASAAQVSIAFGGTAAAGVGGKFALVPICEFQMTGSPLGVLGVQVWALVRTGAGAFQGKQPGGVSVSGVADAAYFFPALRQLTMFKDGHAVLCGPSSGARARRLQTPPASRPRSWPWRRWSPRACKAQTATLISPCSSRTGKTRMGPGGGPSSASPVARSNWP